MTLGQRVAVLNRGELQQVGSPGEIYERPANTFVAQFIGSPGMNLVYSSLHCKHNKMALEMGSIHHPIPQQLLLNFPALLSHCGEKIVVGIRPHAIHLSNAQSGYNLPARVCSVEALGHETILHLKTELTMHATDKVGQDIAMGESSYLLVQLTGHRNFTIGEQLYVHFGVENLSFFDRNGEAIHSLNGN
jgi:multiple sugar transport system ATP-binding protein